MHTHRIDNLAKADHPATRKTDLHNTSYHVWFGVPVPVRCWLLGHDPEYLTTPVPRLRCSRCYAEPQLSEHGRHFLASGRVPEQSWIRDVADRTTPWRVNRQGKASAQVVIPTKPRARLDLHLHVGGVGSETPWDGSINVAGAAVYWSLGINGKLAQRLHPRSKGARDLRFGFEREGDTRWPTWRWQWSLWTDDWGRDTGLEEKAPAKWRRGYKSGSVADRLWGKVKVEREVRDEKLVAVDLGDDLQHLIRFRLEWVVIGRPRQRPHTKERHWEVDWSAESGPGLHGIGLRTERVKGTETWTRGRVFGSSLRISHPEATDGHWEDHAVSALRRWVDERRARENHPRAVVGG